jgi:hypothetical protein
MQEFDNKWTDLFCKIIIKDGNIEIITPKGDQICGILNVTVTQDKTDTKFANAVVNLLVKLHEDKPE